MLRLCAIVCLVSVAFCLPSRDLSRAQEVVATLSVTNGGTQGTWRKDEMCPIGTYATGFELNTDNGQWIGDETALNGIEIICSPPELGDDSFQGIANSLWGAWGDWKGQQMCDQGGAQKTFLRKFQLRAEETNTGANNLIFECSGFDGGDAHSIEGEGTNWGTWGEWSDTCPVDSAICGIKTNFQNPDYIDDTAINDVVFYCCLLE